MGLVAEMLKYGNDDLKNIVLQEYINEYKKQLAEESEERQNERTDLQGRIDDLTKQLDKVKVDAEAYAVAYF